MFIKKNAKVLQLEKYVLSVFIKWNSLLDEE